MEFDEPYIPPDQSPIVDDRIAEATHKYARGLIRVTVEMKRSRRGRGWGKVNSFKLRSGGAGRRPEESDEAINEAIMGIAVGYAEEYGGVWSYRAKYYRKDVDGNEKRHHIGFAVDDDDDGDRISDAGESGANTEEAIIAMYVQMLAQQSDSHASQVQMLMDFCQNLADKLTVLSSQSEPVIATQNRAIAYFQQAMTMSYEAAQVRGPNTTNDDEDGGFVNEVLLPSAKIALAQHLESKTPTDSQESQPQESQQPTTPMPRHPVAYATKALMRSLEPEQWWDLQERLSPSQRELLRRAGRSKTDVDAAGAVVALKEELATDLPRGLALKEILTQAQWDGLQRIAELAVRRAQDGVAAQQERG